MTISGNLEVHPWSWAPTATVTGLVIGNTPWGGSGPLASLRRFTEDLQTALNVPTYYNEALGSTCEVTTYDRVKGRPGDVPDQSVGASGPEKH